MAYVPQIRSAAIPLTVEQMVVLGRFPYLSPWQMAPGAGDLARVDQALATVGLESLRRRSMDALSGGERQAVFIAAALAQEAEVLLLDEPTTHLDARHRREVASLLTQLRADRNQSIVLSTHDLNLAAKLADRVLALKSGRVVALDDPDKITRPERLAEIFDAPFEVFGDRGRTRVLLQLDE
jgi:iron complex transport system ATP-binding protein